jgi:predicted GNAT family N-acyltransferase
MCDIRLLSTQDELRDVGKLRYEIYVEEMGRSQRYADDALRLVIEPVDCLPSTRVLVAYSGSELIATSRIRIYRPGEDQSDLVDYGIPSSLSREMTITEGTKYMIKKSHRGDDKGLGLRMMVFAYELLLEEGVDLDLLNANDYLVPYYRGRGYRRCGESYRHRELGQTVFPMALLVRDHDYLRKVGSPLYGETLESVYPAEAGRLRDARSILDRCDS